MVSLQFHRVYFAYFNGFGLQDINLAIDDAERVALLGPNGSGKTTLIKLASGILKPKQGEISLNGFSLSQLSRKSIARSVAVVPQQFHIPFAFSTSEVIMLGRTPFINTLTGETVVDRQVVARTMELVDISHFAQRPFDELSGGERQKTILAMALAQQPKLLLLDEPTVHLDICHQVETLELVKRLNIEQGLTVIAAMHDLNLASFYFDRLVLLKEGSIFADGTPALVLTEANIREVFSTPVKVETHPTTGTPHIIVMPPANATKRE